MTTAAGEIAMTVAINAHKTGTIATSTVVTTADFSNKLKQASTDGLPLSVRTSNYNKFFN